MANPTIFICPRKTANYLAAQEFKPVIVFKCSFCRTNFFERAELESHRPKCIEHDGHHSFEPVKNSATFVCACGARSGHGR